MLTSAVKFTLRVRKFSTDITATSTTNSTNCVCLGFLRDRPLHILPYVQKVHLRIGDSPYKPVWENVASSLWEALCDTINTDLALQRLTLHIQGDIFAIGGGSPHSYWDPLPRECCGLYRISGLQYLEVRIFTKNRFEETTELTDYVSGRMLRRGRSLGAPESNCTITGPMPKNRVPKYYTLVYRWP